MHVCMFAQVEMHGRDVGRARDACLSKHSSKLVFAYSCVQSAVPLRASRGADGRWAFSAAGVALGAFDARPVLSRCSEPSEVQRLDTERSRLVEQALYAVDGNGGSTNESGDGDKGGDGGSSSVRASSL